MRFCSCISAATTELSTPPLMATATTWAVVAVEPFAVVASSGWSAMVTVFRALWILYCKTFLVLYSWPEKSGSAEGVVAKETIMDYNSALLIWEKTAPLNPKGAAPPSLMFHSRKRFLVLGGELFGVVGGDFAELFDGLGNDE